MKAYTIQQYLEVDCPLRNPSPIILLGVVRETNGRACITGCVYYDGGKCESYKKLVSTFVGEGPDISLTTHTGRWSFGIPSSNVAKQNRTNTVPGYVKPRSQAERYRHIEYSETVKEQALRMGVSLSEVRRIRNAEANAIETAGVPKVHRVHRVYNSEGRVIDTFKVTDDTSCGDDDDNPEHWTEDNS